MQQRRTTVVEAWYRLLDILTAALWESLILSILLAVLLYNKNSMAWGLIFQTLSRV
jgi:hypothetical protein